MLIELLRSAAADVPEQPAVLSAGGSSTYTECLDRSEALARGLRSRGIERFACVVDDIADLLALLCASSATGSEACIYPPDADEDGIAEYAAAFDHAVAATDRTLTLERPRPVPLDNLASSDGELPAAPRGSPVLILTTGTTGRPKGALHDWARLAAVTRGGDARPAHRWLLAYNVSQFAGVQILLHVLASRGTLVVPASPRPQDALAAIREFEVTHASATPTFWRLLVSQLDEHTARELPLRQITLGGEAVPASVLEELRNLFPDARISQVYASTEFGSSLSVRDAHAGLPVSVLSRGDDAEVQFQIRGGELYARSRVGMLGYFGEEEADDGWRPTGDLVEVRDDRIHFVARAGDTINVGGVKVHPLPVEELVSGVEGVKLARAYGRPNPVTGQIVAVDVVAEPGVDTGRLKDRIRQACEALPPAGRPRRIRFVPELDVRGHKIARRPVEAEL